MVWDPGQGQWEHFCSLLGRLGRGQSMGELLLLTGGPGWGQWGHLCSSLGALSGVHGSTSSAPHWGSRVESVGTLLLSLLDPVQLHLCHVMELYPQQTFHRVPENHLLLSSTHHCFPDLWDSFLTEYTMIRLLSTQFSMCYMSLKALLTLSSSHMTFWGNHCLPQEFVSSLLIRV